MTPEAGIIEAANDLTALIEADSVPKHQATRDKAMRPALRKVYRLMRGRFRAQRKAVLDSHALANLKTMLDGRRGVSESLREVESSRRVTGSTDAPLTDAGRVQMHALRQRIGSDVAVFTAPNSRSRESGRIVNPDAQDAEWLRPWGLGRYEGMSLDAARDTVNRLITDTPDASPGVSRYSGREGDSFNQVAARLIAGTVAQRAMMKPGARTLNISSGRALHIIHSAAIRQFQSIDKDELVRNADFSKPGDLFRLCGFGLVKMSEWSDTSCPGQYFAQHGETDWNEGAHTSEALREADDPDRARIEADIAAALGPHVYNQPVTADEQQTFTGAIRAAIDTGGEAVTDMLGSTAPGDAESFIAEYLKDGGFSRLTGDLDRTTVDRLASAVADAYESGADFDGIVQAVKDSFADATNTRATMIAQTELNDAWNQSVMHFGGQAGATQKVWVIDPGACIVCVENTLDGAIGIEDEFSSGDDAPPAHPNCFLPETVVTAVGGISGGFRRRYKGEVCVLSFAGLPNLTVTPNHPILTRLGWMPAGKLKIHDDVLQRCGPSYPLPLRFVDPHHDYVEARIDQIFDALCLASGGAACGVPISAEAFHGDASADNEVDVVYPAGKLTLYDSEGPEDFQYLSFADGRLTPDELERERSLCLLFDACDSAPRGRMRGFRVSLSLLNSESRVSDESRRTGIALLETDSVPVPGDRDTADSNTLGDGQNAFPCKVRTVKITKIERRQFDGHVYNLETKKGFYFANSILVHNCNCSI